MVSNLVSIPTPKQDALYAYGKAITDDPKLQKPYIKKGEILRQLNKPLEAVEVYNQALQVNPNFIEAYSERGETRFNYLGLEMLAIKCRELYLTSDRNIKPLTIQN